MTDVIQLMDMLNISSAYVAGHSMGGAIAQVIAHRYADRVIKVFLCNTFMKINPISEKVFEGVLTLFKQNASRAEIMDLISPWVFSDNFMTPDLRRQIHEFVSTDPLWQNAKDYERQLQAIKWFDSSSWVKEIRVPTIVVGSREDRVASLEESIAIADHISGARLAVLEGGHASAMEQPSAFYHIIDNEKKNENSNRK